MSNSMSTGAAQPAGFADAAILERGYRKATWRLIPFIVICYLFNDLDRVDVGFAKLEMLDGLQHARWLTPEEKAAMKQALDADGQGRRAGSHAVHAFSSVLRNGHVWMLGLTGRPCRPAWSTAEERP
jgi:hypothetical protein